MVDPTITLPHKGRAVVPMTATVEDALKHALKAALTDHVIEWAGKRVASVKRGVAKAGERAGLGHVTAHMLRHSAAVHMAEDGVPMEEIAQFLGHTNANITRRVYARFSPTYLRKAAKSVDFGPLDHSHLKRVGAMSESREYLTPYSARSGVLFLLRSRKLVHWTKLRMVLPRGSKKA